MNSREFSHYVDVYQVGRGLVRALCGTSIRRTGHVNEPTCPECRQHLASAAASLQQLQAEDPAPAPPVATGFDPCAGYTPRGEK